MYSRRKKNEKFYTVLFMKVSLYYSCSVKFIDRNYTLHF